MNEPLDPQEAFKLRVLLLQRRLRQADVAQPLHLDEGQLSRILNGRLSPPQRFEGQFVDRFEAVVNELRPAPTPAPEPVGVA